MIKTREMHKLFIKELKSNIANLKNQQDVLKGCLLLSKSAIRRVSPFFADYSNHSLEEIENNTSGHRLKVVLKSTCPDYPVVNSLLTDFKEQVKSLAKFKEELRIEEATLYSLAIYRQIIKSYNQYIRDLMVNTGFVFGMPHGCGSLYVKRKENKTPVKRVNWLESNKTKAAILEKGLIPYNKEAAPEGVKWLVKHSNDYDVWYTWKKSSSNVTNAVRYSFKPVDGAVKILNATRKDNPLIDYKYNE
jgi:hypothetical protein